MKLSCAFKPGLVNRVGGGQPRWMSCHIMQLTRRRLGDVDILQPTCVKLANPTSGHGENFSAVSLLESENFENLVEPVKVKLIC